MAQSTEAEATSLDELPITVTIEMDRKQLSFSELEALSDGDVIQFTEKRTDKVKLLANGIHFADALLVVVDDTLVVRIDRIH